METMVSFRLAKKSLGKLKTRINTIKMITEKILHIY